MKILYLYVTKVFQIDNHTIPVTAKLALFSLLSVFYNISASADEDPLKVINKQFRQEYAQLRDSIQQQSKPVIFQIGSSLFLEKSDGTSEKASAVGPLYHELKSVSHIPFTLYIILIPYIDQQLPQKIINNLSGYKDLLQAAKESLPHQGFSEEQLARQFSIVQNSEALLSRAIEKKMVKRQTLKDFTRQQASFIKSNLYDVAKSQINTMHEQMQIWEKQLSKDEWDRLRVIISGSHMPRVGNIALQYFSVLKGQPYEGKYQQENILNSDFSVIYTENTFKKQEAIGVMATHLLDEGAGEYFFNDKQRMHRDILADDAEKIIRGLLGKDG